MAIILKNVYTKKMGSESMGTPHVFFQNLSLKPNLELNFNINNLGQNMYEIEMTSTVTTTDQDDNTVSLIQVVKGALFEITDIPEDDIEEVLNVNLPSVVFPYLRQEVENIVHYSGFPPFHIQPISFYTIYESKKSKG
jgi:preprotein translocase subunit SecB